MHGGIPVRRGNVLRHFFLLTAVAVGLVLAPLPGAGAASATTFSGRAVVVDGTIAGVPITLSDTGPLSSQGGALEATLLCYPAGPSCSVGVPDLTSGALRAEVLHAATVAHGNKSRSEASVADFSLTAAAQTISADFLSSRATASCNNGVASVSGSSEIASLSISGINGGQPITVTGAVNQQVPLPAGGAVVINQQIGSASGNQGSLTVNALHVTIPATGPVPATNVVVASAHADIVCANPPPKCDSANDFVTGGGWILTTGGARANFAAAGGYKSGVPWGHFTYIDHGTGLKVKGTGVTSYAVTGPTSRHVEGTAEINGVPGSYKLDLADNGEPGRNDDFAVSLSTGYTAGGKLAGGNIQLHGSCQ